MRFSLLCSMLLLCVICGIPPVSADVIPPAYPVQDYSFEVINADAYPGYVFVVYPLSSGGGYQVAGKGVTITLPQGFSTNLYAFSAENYGIASVAAMIRDASSGQWTSPAVPAFTGVAPYQAIPNSVRAAHERYTIEAVNQSRLSLIAVSGRFSLFGGETLEVSYDSGQEPPGKPHYNWVGPVIPHRIGTTPAIPTATETATAPTEMETPVSTRATPAATGMILPLAAGGIAAILLMRRRVG